MAITLKKIAQYRIEAALVLGAFLSLAAAASAQASTVTRSFSTATPAACSTLDVSLAVGVVPPDTTPPNDFYIIDEITPTGWTIANPGTGDASQPGHIKWAVLSGAVSVANQYSLTAPCAAGTGVFSGEFAFGSNAALSPILGPTSVTVQAPPAAPVLTSISLSPQNSSIAAGGTAQLSAQVLDQFGAPLTPQPAIVWTSANPAIASVGASGLVTGVSAGGPVAISASSGNVSGAAIISVTAPLPPPPSATGSSLALAAPGQWAVFSAPKKLSSIAIAAADVDAILSYDAAAGQFTQIASLADPALLNPLNAFYIKPNKVTAITFTYAVSAAPELLTKNLSKGWNLVGTNNAGLAKDEFSSIQTAPGVAGMITLNAPQTENARKSIFADWALSADKDLNANPVTDLPPITVSPYDGYWVNVGGPMVFSKLNQ